MIVAFWSPFAGVSAASSGMLATVLATAIANHKKCSVMNIGYDTQSSFPYFMPRSNGGDLQIYENTGVDALLRESKSKVMSAAEVEDYAFSFAEKRINVFTPTNIVSEVLYIENVLDAIENVFKALRSAYQISFVDVESGVNEYSKAVLPLVDLVVVCLPQSSHRIEMYFEKYKVPNKNAIYLLSDYDAHQKVNQFYLQFKYSKHLRKSTVIVLPHNSEYANSLNSATAISYYLRNIQCTAKDSNYQFIKSSKANSSMILKRCSVRIKEDESE